MCTCSEIQKKAIKSAQQRLDNGYDAHEVETFLEKINETLPKGHFENQNGLIIFIEEK